jgi:hypothetical protein
MLFASAELVRRIEGAEVRLVTDGARAAAQRRPGDPTFILPLAGGVATFAGPGSPLDKVAGVGLAGPLDEAALAAVEQAYTTRGVAVQVELPTHADPSVGALLTRRGYALVGFEDVLGRTLRLEDGPEELAVRVTTSEAGELRLWLDTIVTGFASPDGQGVPSHDSFGREALERAIADLAAAAGMTRYLARVGGTVAGAASLRTSEGVAHLAGAATLTTHRRRGVQGALLSTRLRDAARAGCDLAVVTTLPGSRSQHNMRRLGFDLLYTRAILVLAPRSA